VSAQQPAGERIDYNAIYKIKDEGFQRSKVMETLSWLTDVYGPRRDERLPRKPLPAPTGGRGEGRSSRATALRCLRV